MNQPLHSRWPRFVVRLFIVAALGGAGVIYLVRQQREQQRRDELAREAAAEEQVLLALEQTVTIEFGREVSLRTWLAEFTRQTGIAVQAELEFTTGGAGDPFGGEDPGPLQRHVRHVELDLYSLPAHQALDLLSEHLNWQWELRSDKSVLLAHYNSSEFRDELSVQHFIFPEDQEFLARDEALRIWQTFVEPYDAEVTMRRMSVTPNGLAVLQSRRAHLLARQFFRRLETVRERLRELPDLAAADDPAWQPIVLVQQSYRTGRTNQFLAWPIGDLTAGGDRLQNAQALQRVLFKAFSNEDPYDRELAPTLPIAAGGRLLFVKDWDDYQASIGRLLTALRQVRSGSTWQAAAGTPSTIQSTTGELAARLDTPLAFEFRDATRVAMQDELRFRGAVDFPDSSAGPNHHVWSYLPPRPLREQLKLVLGEFEYDHALCDQLSPAGRPPAVNLDPWEHHYGVEVFDLRPWLPSLREQDDLLRLLSNDRDDATIDRAFRPAMFRGLVVVRCRPQLRAQLSQTLSRLKEYLTPRQPRRWNGRPLMGDSLSQPLEMFAPDEQRAIQVAELNRKLQLPVNARFRGEQLGDVLLGLAREYELPMLISDQQKRPSPLQTALVNREVDNVPLGELLQQLIGDRERYRWNCDAGYLTIEEQIPKREEHLSEYYSVEDLVVPRGRLQPGQLVRTLVQSLQKNVRPNNTPFTWLRCEFYFRQLLRIDANTEEPVRAEIEHLLRRLRSGELQPLPLLDPDAECDFDVPDFAPYAVELVPVVGARENGWRERWSAAGCGSLDFADKQVVVGVRADPIPDVDSVVIRDVDRAILHRD